MVMVMGSLCSQSTQLFDIDTYRRSAEDIQLNRRLDVGKNQTDKCKTRFQFGFGQDN
jgi:hypothetical protein